MHILYVCVFEYLMFEKKICGHWQAAFFKQLTFTIFVLEEMYVNYSSDNKVIQCLQNSVTQLYIWFLKMRRFRHKHILSLDSLVFSEINFIFKIEFVLLRFVSAVN